MAREKVNVNWDVVREKAAASGPTLKVLSLCFGYTESYFSVKASNGSPLWLEDYNLLKDILGFTDEEVAPRKESPIPPKEGKLAGSSACSSGMGSGINFSLFAPQLQSISKELSVINELLEEVATRPEPKGKPSPKVKVAQKPSKETSLKKERPAQVKKADTATEKEKRPRSNTVAHKEPEKKKSMTPEEARAKERDRKMLQAEKVLSDMMKKHKGKVKKDDYFREVKRKYQIERPDAVTAYRSLGCRVFKANEDGLIVHYLVKKES